MKKILSLIAMIALVFTSCDPLEDINNEVAATISSEELVYGITADEEITLTEEDYESMNLSANYIYSKQFAKDSLPEFLANLYPTYGKSSSVLVNYNFYRSMKVTVAPNQYPDATKIAFSSTDDIEAHMINVLGSGEDDDSHLVTYQVRKEERIVSTIYEQGFESEEAFSDDRVFDLAGENFQWGKSSYGSDVYARISAYDRDTDSRETSNDWWVSPEIDLTDYQLSTFQIKQSIHFADGVMDAQKIKISKDFNGSVEDATWEEIFLENRPAGNSYDYVTSEKYDLSDFDGEKIHIAFQYIATEANSSRWAIDNFEVGGSSFYETYQEVFVFNKTALEWKRDSNPYVLTSDDYQSMGIEGFDATIQPDHYLPIFFAKQQQYAYPLDGQSVNVLYTMNKEVAASQYTFTGGQWVASQSMIDSSMKFEHNGTKWVAVEIIEYKMKEEDYKNIAENYGKLPEFTDVKQSLFDNLKEYGNFGYVWVDNLEKEWDQDTNLAYPILQYFLTQFIADYPDAKPGQKVRLSFDYYSYGDKAVTQEFIMNEDGGFDFETAPVIVQQ